MEGHEETSTPFDPGAADSSAVPASDPPTDTSTVPAADSPAAPPAWLVELEDRVEAIEAAVERAVGRLDHLGQGGETAGDALRIAHYAVACARELSAGISRATGSHIPLPPAPASAPGVEAASPPAGVETMEGVAGIT